MKLYLKFAGLIGLLVLICRIIVPELMSAADSVLNMLGIFVIFVIIPALVYLYYNKFLKTDVEKLRSR